MILTDEQTHAVDLFKKSDSLKISAFAGTGKTSTLTAIGKSTQKSGLYLAFNKSIATEAASRFPKSVECRTTHSIAFRAVPSEYRQNMPKLTNALNSNHVAKLLGMEELAVGGVILKPRAVAFSAIKTVQRFCQSGDEDIIVRHVPLTGKLDQIEPRYQQEFQQYVSKLAAHLWDCMLDPDHAAPLGHDGYLKLWSLSKPRLNHDFLLLDEAQDTNEAVLSVLRLQDSHLTLVGDRHQQIYAWRGAVNAMANVETDAEAVLTQSFRFGDTVAAAATTILKVLDEKRALRGDPNKQTRIAATGATGTVLCRTNAGVISVVIDALAEGRKPHVVGGVDELIRMLEDVTRLKRGMEAAASPEFFGFSNWDEIVEFAGTDEGESLRAFVKIVDAYGELTLIDRLRSVASDEKSAGLVVSTGHKAKGREWDSVTLAGDFDLRVAKDNPDQPVLNPEEARLLYVAATRARQLLVVPSRLAKKWNVAPAPSVAAAPVPVAPPLVAPARAIRPLPPPPAFAKVIAPPVYRPQAAPEIKVAIARPGLLASVVSYLFGKK